MIKILIKRLSKEALPKYETKGASGMDLAANINTKIYIDPGKSAVIPTGLALSIPKGYEVQLAKIWFSCKKYKVLNTRHD